MVKIKTRDELLRDVIKAGKKHSRDWGAIFGVDKKLISQDYYIFHPKMGVYLLKEYQKNPFDLKGVGCKIARRVDEELEENVSRHTGSFGIIQGDLKKILKNLEMGMEPVKIFDAALKGDDLGIKMPIRGKAASSKKIYEHVHREFSDKQKKVESEFRKLAEEEGLYKSYS